MVSMVVQFEALLSGNETQICSRIPRIKST